MRNASRKLAVNLNLRKIQSVKISSIFLSHLMLDKNSPQESAHAHSCLQVEN